MVISSFGCRCGGQPLDVPQQRLQEQPVGRIQDHQPDPVAPGLPLGLDLVGLGRVHRHVDGRDVVRQRPRVAQRLQRPLVHAADRQDHPVARGDARLRLIVVERQMGRQVLVVMVDPEEDEHQRRRQHHDDPRSILELGDGKDKHHDRRADSAKAVNDHLELPTGLVAQRRAALLDLLAGGQVADLPPAAGHAGLRQGERQEHADGVERDQGGDAGLEEDDQQAGDQSQRHDAPREDQPAAPVGELPRQETVAGVQRAQPGKVGKRRVGRHDQDERGRRDESPGTARRARHKRSGPTGR